jgi:nifR3 family TIM-barrel protein
MKKPETKILLGQVSITGDLLLAPMDGYTDQPFRSFCRDLGSAASYTEFVRAEDVLERPAYIADKLRFLERERPVFIQLYGHEVHSLLEAALRLEEREPDAIDLNLGCPNKSITRRGAGAGLMLTPLKTARIFRTLSRALQVPLTAKIRLGWNDCRNYLLISRIIAENGGALLAIHARTKEQGHQGKADWEAIAEVKSTLDIPVIGNGGISSASDLDSLQNQTNCDAVMIGRAALKNPWIFQRLDREQVNPVTVLEGLLNHLDRSLEFYGDKQGLVLFRKFAAGYLAPYQIDRQRRKSLLTETNPARFRFAVRELIKEQSSGLPDHSD